MELNVVPDAAVLPDSGSEPDSGRSGKGKKSRKGKKVPVQATPIGSPASLYRYADCAWVQVL